ncbi:hypothetical protein [Chengkuizengella sediminis]|nr:hypothetical protein [Chengkuizengella sediminis]
MVDTNANLPSEEFERLREIEKKYRELEFDICVLVVSMMLNLTK